MQLNAQASQTDNFEETWFFGGYFETIKFWLIIIYLTFLQWFFMCIWYSGYDFFPFYITLLLIFEQFVFDWWLAKNKQLCWTTSFYVLWTASHDLIRIKCYFFSYQII